MKFHLWVMTLLLIISARASATLSPRMYPWMAQINISVREYLNSSETKIENNKLSLEVLYFVRGGISVGGQFMTEKRNQPGRESGESWGILAGYYLDSGFFGLVQYDFFSRLGDWKDGLGYQLNGGYLHHWNNKFHLGVKYSHRNMLYPTNSADDTVHNRHVTESYPSVVFMFIF